MIFPHYCILSPHISHDFAMIFPWFYYDCKPVTNHWTKPRVHLSGGSGQASWALQWALQVLFTSTADFNVGTAWKNAAKNKSDLLGKFGNSEGLILSHVWWFNQCPFDPVICFIIACGEIVLKSRSQPWMGKGNHFHPSQRPNASLSDDCLPGSLDGFDSEKSTRNRGPVLYFFKPIPWYTPIIWKEPPYKCVYIYILYVYHCIQISLDFYYIYMICIYRIPPCAKLYSAIPSPQNQKHHSVTLKNRHPTLLHQRLGMVCW